MIGVDLDGTILNYGGHAAGEIRIAVARIGWIAMQAGDIAILSNQGGVNFHDANPAKYPSIEQIVARVVAVQKTMRRLDCGRLTRVRMATYHPNADPLRCIAVAKKLELALSAHLNARIEVSGAPTWRKPQPGMFAGLHLAAYVGDSDEDGLAADAAGVKFLKVERFS